MGVRGLTTFIEDFFDAYWLTCKPEGGMVFDGYSLFFTLFLQSGIDWIHGGQYWLFRDRLLEFFESLKTSGIQAIVIMDGVECEKNPVILKRMSDTIEGIRQVYTEVTEHTTEDSTSLRLLPVLTLQVFVKVLEEIGVPFYVADGEGDPITVAFANHYHYPIVANDSDYYMFNVDYGYIPLDRLYWETQPVTAEMYMLTTFNQVFGINNLQLSRAIPAILGNDYIEGQMGVFIRQGIISLAAGYNVSSLVRYVSKVQSIDQLLSHIERTLDNGQAIAKTILVNIEKAKSIYNITATLSKEDIMNNSVLVSANNKKIPWWIIQQYRQGQFHVDLIRALISGQCFFRAAAEDPLKPTSCRASRGIRQFIYSLLSPLLKEKTITEMIRTAESTWPVAFLAPEEVSFSAANIVLPSLYNMNKVSLTKKVSVFCEMIGVRHEVLDLFDKEWKLVVLAACYWVKECSPSQILIKSLVMCFLHCSNLKNTTDREILSSLPNMYRTAVWMEALHMFACFQHIYLDMMSLNNVLQNPLVTVSPAFFFDGKFVQMYTTCTDEFEKIVNKEFVPSPLYEKLMRTLTSFKLQS